MKRILTLLVFFYSFAFLTAQETPRVPVYLADYASTLGMTIDQVQDEYGSPSHMFVYQGKEDRNGSVVFYFQDSFSLFWADDRVWQLRIDDRFTDPDQASLIGQTRQGILADWGEPLLQNETMVLYDLPDTDFPIRCALYFSEADILLDLYLFRSDY